MFIATREVFGGQKYYFETNENDSPKWTTDIKEAKRFETVNDALTKSDVTGIYQIIAIKVQS
jgi:hypothetical protein